MKKKSLVVFSFFFLTLLCALLFTYSVLNAIDFKKVIDTLCMRNGRIEGVWQFYSSLQEKKKFKLCVCRLRILPDVQPLFCSFFMRNSFRNLPKVLLVQLFILNETYMPESGMKVKRELNLFLSQVEQFSSNNIPLNNNNQNWGTWVVQWVNLWLVMIPESWDSDWHPVLCSGGSLPLHLSLPLLVHSRALSVK